MVTDGLFSRDEVLGGLPARRAASALFLIESRTAHLVDQSRRAADFLLSEEATKERDLAFLEAFSVGREPPVRPTVQDLERFAPQWTPLVPANPQVRAAIARLLGERYRFTRAAVPRLRSALALDDEAVARAYRRLYRTELEALYARRVRPADWLGWAWSGLSARVDALSPFWLTFWLTIALSFSQAFLALPTGVASIGAVPGVVLVVVLGVVNTLTMACMAEACARSGDFRYGRAFVGRLVSNCLGGEASLLFSAVTALRTFLVLLAGSIGIGLTLAGATGVRAEAWIALLGAAELYYLSRRSSSITITTMLALMGMTLLLTAAIAGMALNQVQAANLLGMPLFQRASFDATVLRLAFGVVAMLYIGHVYLVQCAKIVLPRDPSARSLIQGSVAATTLLTVVFVVWVLAVNGALAAETLAAEAGTVLSPLAERIGPLVAVLGAGLVIVLLGMSCLRTSTVLFNLVQERLPTCVRTIVTVPRHRRDLLVEPRGAGLRQGPRLGIRYLGLVDEQARLRIEAQVGGDVERTDVVVGKTWDAAELLARHAGTGLRGARLVLEVLEARPEIVRLRVTTTMSLGVAPDRNGGGWHLADAVGLGDPSRGLVNWLVRRGEASLGEVLNELGGRPDEVRTTLQTLVGQGLVETAGGGDEPRYRVRLAARRGRQVPAEIWAAVASPGPAAPGIRPRGPGGLAGAAWRFLLSEGGRFVVSASPVLLVFLICEGLLVTGSASFAGVLGFGGVIANSLTAGIFPVLLLLASRRKGECVPGIVYGPLGHPVFAGAIFSLFLANLFLHGLVIYRTPWVRACALLAGLTVIVMTVRMVRRGAFRRRSVIELREDAREGGKVILTIASGGRPLIADVRLGDGARATGDGTAALTVPGLAALQGAALELPPGEARELKVWAHRVTAEGTSEGLPLLVEIHGGGQTGRFDLGLSEGQVMVPVDGTACTVRVALPAADEP